MDTIQPMAHKQDTDAYRIGQRSRHMTAQAADHLGTLIVLMVYLVGIPTMLALGTMIAKRRGRS